jgi:DNA gyrase subunit A
MNDDRHMADCIRERLEIVEAFLVAFERRRELLRVVETASGADTAVPVIMDRFGLNQVQAHAVLDLQVRRFAEADRWRVSDEADQLRRQLDRM